MTLHNGAILKMCHADGTPYTEEKDGIEHTFEVIAMGNLWNGKEQERIVKLKLIK